MWRHGPVAGIAELHDTEWQELSKRSADVDHWPTDKEMATLVNGSTCPWPPLQTHRRCCRHSIRRLFVAHPPGRACVCVCARPPDELVVLLGRMLRERSLMASETSIHLYASAWRTYLELFALAAGTRPSGPLVLASCTPPVLPSALTTIAAKHLHLLPTCLRCEVATQRGRVVLCWVVRVCAPDELKARKARLDKLPLSWLYEFSADFVQLYSKFHSEVCVCARAPWGPDWSRQSRYWCGLSHGASVCHRAQFRHKRHRHSDDSSGSADPSVVAEENELIAKVWRLLPTSRMTRPRWGNAAARLGQLPCLDTVGRALNRRPVLSRPLLCPPCWL